MTFWNSKRKAPSRFFAECRPPTKTLTPALSSVALLPGGRHFERRNTTDFAVDFKGPFRGVKALGIHQAEFVAFGETCILMSHSDDRLVGILTGALITFGAQVKGSAAATPGKIPQYASWNANNGVVQVNGVSALFFCLNTLRCKVFMEKDYDNESVTRRFIDTGALQRGQR